MIVWRWKHDSEGRNCIILCSLPQQTNSVMHRLYRLYIQLGTLTEHVAMRTFTFIDLTPSKQLQCPRPTSSVHTPVRWWRSLSLRWGCRRRVGSRSAACWSRGPGSWSGPWSSRAWSAVDWASPTPCCTRSLCTCMERERGNLQNVLLVFQIIHLLEEEGGPSS